MRSSGRTKHQPRLPGRNPATHVTGSHGSKLSGTDSLNIVLDSRRGHNMAKFPFSFQTPSGWPLGSDAANNRQTLFEPFDPSTSSGLRLRELVLHKKRLLCFRSLHWPYGVAEQCSQHREQGAHCLSAASLCTAGPVLSKAEGAGEPRREPEGSHHGQHGFAHFCRNKRGSAAGPKPGNTKTLAGTNVSTTQRCAQWARHSPLPKP